MRKNKKIFLLFFLLIFLVSVPYVSKTDAAELQYTLLEKIPGATNNGSDLKSYVENIYRVALAVVVLSALFMLTVGGFMYLTSAGNTSAMSTAKSVIFDSLIGLVIALSAWLFLNVINPDLVNVTLNGLSAVPVAPVPGAAPGVVTAPPGTCASCVDVSGVSIKPVGQGCANPGPCKLNEAFLNKLKTLPSNPSWWVTEAWPPTVTHSSSCHSNGTCADINFTGGITDVASVKTFYNTIKGAGFNTVYETFSDCAPYTAAGILCKRFNTTTGSHFHVY